VTRLDANGFAAAMIPNDEIRACYPYEFEFTVTYRFLPLGLSCEFALTNHGQEPIPWSSGHHFYFTVPWSDGAKRSDYVIRLPAGKRLKQDMTNGQLMPGPVLQTTEPLSNPNLIDTLHTNLASSEIVFGERDRSGDVTVRVSAEKVPPPQATFVTWTLDEAAPFYCVEPWMGPPNAAEHKVGLHWVKPGSTERFTVSVGVQ
jgi:galactose mutarotase-like enzyme